MFLTPEIDESKKVAVKSKDSDELNGDWDSLGDELFFRKLILCSDIFRRANLKFLLRLLIFFHSFKTPSSKKNKSNFDIKSKSLIYTTKFFQSQEKLNFFDL